MDEDEDEDEDDDDDDAADDKKEVNGDAEPPSKKRRT